MKLSFPQLCFRSRHFWRGSTWRGHEKHKRRELCWLCVQKLLCCVFVTGWRSLNPKLRGAMMRCTGWRVRNDTKLDILWYFCRIQDICRVFPFVFFFSNFLQFFQAARKPEGEGEGPRFGRSLFLSLFSSEILCFVRGKRILCFTVRLRTVLFLVPCFIYFHLVSVAEEPEKEDKADADAELTVELFRAIMKDDAQQDRHRTKQRMGWGDEEKTTMGGSEGFGGFGIMKLLSAKIFRSFSPTVKGFKHVNMFKLFLNNLWYFTISYV